MRSGSPPLWLRHFQKRELALLVLGVSTLNLDNRLNVTMHQVAEVWDSAAANEWASGAQR